MKRAASAIRGRLLGVLLCLAVLLPCAAAALEAPVLKGRVNDYRRHAVAGDGTPDRGPPERAGREGLDPGRGAHRPFAGRRFPGRLFHAGGRTLEDRPQGVRQRRHPAGRARRPQGQDRGGLRPGGPVDGPHGRADHPGPDRARVPGGPVRPGGLERRDCDRRSRARRVPGPGPAPVRSRGVGPRRPRAVCGLLHLHRGHAGPGQPAAGNGRRRVLHAVSGAHGVLAGACRRCSAWAGQGWSPASSWRRSRPPSSPRGLPNRAAGAAADTAGSR